MPFISILTPTYNRGNLLLPLYDSLKNLTFNDFEWLIIDDGSEDDTEQYALSWIAHNIENAKFLIRYFKKSNGGKHTAINRGVREASGELILILDSDDTLPSDSLTTIAQYYELCKGYKDCAGVCGLMAHHDGQLIGTGFPKEPMYESALQFRYAEKGNVTGDLLEVYKTSVMREGGLTSKIVRIRMNSPIASTMTYAEMLDYNISLKWKIRSAINYWRFKYCITNKSLKAPKVKWYWKAFQIIGLIMHLKDNK